MSRLGVLLHAFGVRLDMNSPVPALRLLVALQLRGEGGRAALAQVAPHPPPMAPSGAALADAHNSDRGSMTSTSSSTSSSATTSRWRHSPLSVVAAWRGASWAEYRRTPTAHISAAAAAAAAGAATPNARRHVTTSSGAHHGHGVELSDGEFQRVADAALDHLQERLEMFVEDNDVDGGDVEYSSGVLTVKLGRHGTYVINKQAPNRQIWLSSPVSGPFRYDYAGGGRWTYSRDGREVHQQLEAELGALLGRAPDLTSGLPS